MQGHVDLADIRYRKAVYRFVGRWRRLVLDERAAVVWGS
jgi:hypothetical protein